MKKFIRPILLHHFLVIINNNNRKSSVTKLMGFHNLFFLLLMRFSVIMYFHIEIHIEMNVVLRAIKTIVYV